MLEVTVTGGLGEVLDCSDDAALIGRVRAGDGRAYGVLYARYLGAARRAAGSLCGSAADREDLVAEAFALVLRALRTGSGPLTEFRPYLLVTLRNLMISTSRRRPVITFHDELPESLPANVGDPVGDRVVSAVAAEALARLPHRWQVVLWHTEVEGQSPATLAPRLGLTPNGVAALACRAREGLRQAYLDLHLPSTEHTLCRTTRTQLASWIRRGMPRQKRNPVTTHIDDCHDCRSAATELAEINRRLGSPLTRHPAQHTAP